MFTSLGHMQAPYALRKVNVIKVDDDGPRGGGSGGGGSDRCRIPCIQYFSFAISLTCSDSFEADWLPVD